MNNVNVTGKIMQLTTKESEKGTMALGTISVYRNSDKESGKAVYDYIPFIAFGFNADRLSKGAIVGLSGRMQSYQVDNGGQYPDTKIQLFVNGVDTFGGNKVNPDSDNPFGHKMDYKGDDLEVTNEDLPGFLQGGNNQGGNN